MNKKIIILIYIFIIFVILAGFQCECGDNDIVENDTTANGEKILQEYFFPTEMNYDGGYAGNHLIDKLYPIGWSKSGKFAYATETSDEGIGVYMFKIEVINLINDEIEWSWETEADEENYREEIWKDNYKEFKKYLNKHEIIQKKNIELGELFFKYKGKEYNLDLITKNDVDPDFGFEIIVETKILLRSPQLGQKTVFEYEEKNYSMILNQMIAGYIMSPYEDRILVVLKNERWGSEGIPSVIYFTFSGSNLYTGFKTDTN